MMLTYKFGILYKSHQITTHLIYRNNKFFIVQLIVLVDDDGTATAATTTNFMHDYAVIVISLQKKQLLCAFTCTMNHHLPWYICTECEQMGDFGSGRKMVWYTNYYMQWVPIIAYNEIEHAG